MSRKSNFFGNSQGNTARTCYFKLQHGGKRGEKVCFCTDGKVGLSLEKDMEKH